MQGSAAVKRLNVVVPHRDRQAHLNVFVPLLRAYFARDKIDRDIPYRALIIEQENGLPFNRGALKNVGFVLGRNHSDYTCFHDVDYLPVWADYSWSDTPTSIVWYGAETRPLSLKNPQHRKAHKIEDFFGGVLLTPNTLFEHVDGYANTYWGWGWEDTDLKCRYQSAGIAPTRRKGSFQALDHDHDGFNPDATPKPAAIANERQFNERWTLSRAPQADGLKTLAFDILDRRPVPEGPVVERPAIWEIVKVRLKMKPPDSQPGT
jgi:N-terminal region of glycosyl transferase group 7/N-terminal domain of galactosyltransferase